MACRLDLHHAFRSISVECHFRANYDFLDEDDLGAYSFRMVCDMGLAL